MQSRNGTFFYITNTPNGQNYGVFYAHAALLLGHLAFTFNPVSDACHFIPRNIFLCTFLQKKLAWPPCITFFHF